MPVWVEVTEPVCVWLGVPERVVEGVPVNVPDCVWVGVVVPVRVAELLDVPLRVAEPLGVDVPVDVGVAL